MNTKPITVAQYGIGPIGAEIARLLLKKPWVTLVAAVDIDQQLLHSIFIACGIAINTDNFMRGK